MCNIKKVLLTMLNSLSRVAISDVGLQRMDAKIGLRPRMVLRTGEARGTACPGAVVLRRSCFLLVDDNTYANTTLFQDCAISGGTHSNRAWAKRSAATAPPSLNLSRPRVHAGCLVCSPIHQLNFSFNAPFCMAD